LGLAVFLLGSGILLMAPSGCQRPPAPDVVATVNGKEITRGELEKYYKSSLGDAPQDPSPEQADIVRLNILQKMIDDEILQQQATKLNLAASDEDVNAKLTEMKALLTQEEFDKQLKERGITLDDLKRDVRRQLTRTKLVNREIESKINITDAEITNYYNANKSEFNLIEPRYRLAQIVVTGNPPQQGGNPQTRKAPNEGEARKEIQAIHTRLESGEDFAALASQFSENANSAQNGGDMGFIFETQLRGQLPDVYNAVTKLRPGQISDSLPLYDGPAPNHKVIGYAVYKLLSREAAGQRGFNDPNVQQSIRQELRERKVQLLQTAYFEMLHDQANVRNYFAEQILKRGAQ
jgi:peptidyl-prolyl cis-trans isomerase SurA